MSSILYVSKSHELGYFKYRTYKVLVDAGVIQCYMGLAF